MELKQTCHEKLAYMLTTGLFISSSCPLWQLYGSFAHGHTTQNEKHNIMMVANWGIRATQLYKTSDIRHKLLKCFIIFELKKFKTKTTLPNLA